MGNTDTRIKKQCKRWCNRIKCGKEEQSDSGTDKRSGRFHSGYCDIFVWLLFVPCLRKQGDCKF